MIRCDLEPDILRNQLIVILWKRPFWMYANEGEKNGASACVHLLNVLYCSKLHSYQRICLYCEVQVYIA